LGIGTAGFAIGTASRHDPPPTNNAPSLDLISLLFAVDAASISSDAIERWSTWAFAQADRIDPAETARFLEKSDLK
jgi:hypothetical protein